MPLSFTSLEFLVFLAATVAVYRLSPVRWRTGVLLAASYGFYLTWSCAAALLMAAVTVLTYLAAMAAESRRRGSRAILLTVVFLLVGYLWSFKLAPLLPRQGIAGIAVPLGISYYTFKLVGYLLDVYWGRARAERRLIPFAAFVAFFPAIVAGPVQRASDFLRQVPARPPALIWDGISRIGWGLAKKVFIADNLARSVEFAYGHTMSLHATPLLIGLYVFPLQLYADFSALTDIAIGCGRLFGIQCPENFARPFTASNIRLFWQRWHMSLTSWFTDYLFTPLRMATRRAGNAGLVGSITVNMVAIGLWHGISWGYVIFGLTHALLVSTDALTSRGRARFFKKHPGLNGMGELLGCLVTFHLVAFSLVFFRAGTVADAIWLITHVLSGPGGDNPGLRTMMVGGGRSALVIGLAGYLVLEMAERLRPDLRWRRIVEGCAPHWLQWVAYTTAAMLTVAAILAMLARSGGGSTTFVYQMF